MIRRNAILAQENDYDTSDIMDICKTEICVFMKREEPNLSQALKALENFDPEQDVFVPVGDVLCNLYCGMALVFLHPATKITIAVYRGKKYFLKELDIQELAFGVSNG